MFYRIFLLLPLLSMMLMASDPIVDYFKAAEKRLTFDHQSRLIATQRDLQISAEKITRVANFSTDLLYAETDAKLLAHRFHTADILIGDTIDIFNKSSLTIEKISLQAQQNRLVLDQQREQLFISLMNMIASYRQSGELLSLHQSLYREQKKISRQLEQAFQAGAIARIETERFNSALSLFQAQIVKEEELLKTMKIRLKLYVPDKPIPLIRPQVLRSSMRDYLANTPALRSKKIEGDIAKTEAEAIEKSWLPDATLGSNYQFDTDPTANGNNFSLFAGVHFGLDGGRSKRAEAVKVKSMRIESEAVSLKVAAQENYVSYIGQINAAKRRIEILVPTAKKSAKTFSGVKKAYIKHYTDFNSYIQSLQQWLRTKEQLINARSLKEKNIAMLNILCRGNIYE